ncbi:MAG: MBL fold metallo-hydrolase [Chloroflexota bacterium]
MSQTKLVLLGTGTPNILPSRYQSSLAIIVDDVPYLVDCGGGAIQRASEAFYNKGIKALQLKNLSRLFLTHLHPDHTTGIPDLIIAPWVLDREESLSVWGPAGTGAMINHLLKAYRIGIGEHRDGLAPIAHPLKVNVTEIATGTVYHDERVSVTAFRGSHGGLDAYGYKFVTQDKTIVISGDTTPTKALIEHATGCDILVHEVYSAEKFQEQSDAWQQYHATSHTSTKQLAEIAKQARPKLLVLVHQLFWGQTEAALFDEVKRYYRGNVVSGHDLDVF